MATLPSPTGRDSVPRREPTMTHDDQLVVHIPLGRRVMVVGDLLLQPEATPSSKALASDLVQTLERWQGPGVVVVCGNLFEGPASPAVLDADLVHRALAAHDDLTRSIRAFASRPDCRFLVLPGWRDPQVRTDEIVRSALLALGAEVAPAIDLRLTTAAGVRRVVIRPGTPADPTTTADGRPTEARSWLIGIDRLEDPRSSGRFVTSRLLYRRLRHILWVPPALAILVAVVLHVTSVFHGLDRLTHREPRAHGALQHAYAASWPHRLLFVLFVIAAFELVLAAGVALASRRIWRKEGGGDLPSPWPHPLAASLVDPSPPGELSIGDHPALDEARALIAAGSTGLITGGSFRAEFTHLDRGFFACTGGTTEFVREHPGRVGLPPVFLPHRQVSWIELETGAELHVRLLLADVSLPTSTFLERFVSDDQVVKGYKVAADLHPGLVASWPRGAAWPPAPEVAADRIQVRRVRRLAASAIFVAGLVDLLIAVTPPLRSRLHLVEQVLPLGVAQAAGALVALAGIALMMLARGVLRGQRRAWLVSLVLLSISLGLHLAHGPDLDGMALSALVLVFLVVERRRFGAATNVGSLRSAVTTLIVGGVVATVAATITVEVSGRVRHHPLPGWLEVAFGSAERLVGLQTVAFPPAINGFLAPSLLAVGVALLVVALFLVTRPVVDRRLSSVRAAGTRRAAESRARDIVRRHGTGTLDYFALRDDKQWFFHRDSLVAYAVYAGVCLVSPDPIGPPSERGQVWNAFRHYVDGNGWAVGVMAAADEWLPIYRDAGMRHVYIGDEAVVDVQTFSLAGGKMKGLRQACGRIARNGYTVEFLDPTTVSPERAEALVDLMGRNRRGDQERGFSMMLGRVFDPRDTGMLLTVVNDPTGVPAAVCQFVPSEAIQGYSLDLMRRDPGEHPNGLLDFALCSTIEHLRHEGKRGLSLNFAAMRSTLDGERGDGVGQRVERWALRRLSGVLPIETLWKFNAKYEPQWLPRYVVFDSAEQFIPTVTQILRAESLTEVPVVGRLLTTSSAKRPDLQSAAPAEPTSTG